jgi:hypothetical protein
MNLNNLELESYKIFIRKNLIKIRPVLIVIISLLAISFLSLYLNVFSMQSKFLSEKKKFTLMQDKIKQNININIANSLPNKEYKKKEKDYIAFINEEFILNPKFQSLIYDHINYRHDIALTITERRIIQRKQKKIFTKSELELTLTGTYEQLGEYLWYLNEVPVLFNYSYLRILPVAGGKQLLNMVLKLHLYFIE